MEKITLKQIKILIVALLSLGFVISVSVNINITIEKKIEAIKQEAWEQGRLSVFQNMGDMVVQGKRQINIPYIFTNDKGETQTTTIPFTPILPTQ